MNKVILIGRLTKDPETRYTQYGLQVTTFTLAVDRRFAKKYSNQPKADFIPIVAWRKLAEICANNLAKGRRVGVYGQMQVRTYDAKDGSKRYITEVLADEVEFLDKKAGGSSQQAAPDGMQDVDDEAIPF